MRYSTRYRNSTLNNLMPRLPIQWQYNMCQLYYAVFEPLTLRHMRYKRFYDFLERSQWWPKEEVEAYQAKRLATIIKYCYEYVPYYQEIFRKRKIRPNDIVSVDGLRKLPILTKEDVVNNLDKLISRKVSIKDRRRLQSTHTSGSTGKPMLFYHDRKARFINDAFRAWRLSLARIKPYSKFIKLWSRPFLEKNIKNIALHEPSLLRLSLSNAPCAIDEANKHLHFIKKFKPDYVAGSPSFLYALACYAQDKGHDDIQFSVFFSHYESLYPYQKSAIEKQFNCEIFRYYSSEEYPVFAVECEKHAGLHIETRKGAMEILDDNGQFVKNGTCGRIVCTGFDNFVMPLIRYDIGDIGAIAPGQCSCGRSLPLLQSLEGRSNEFLFYKNKYIYPATLSFLLQRFRNIKECQFVQEESEKIRINIVKRKQYSLQDTDQLIKNVQQIVNGQLSVDVNFVDKISRTGMGKFQFVVNRLNK